MKVALVGGTGFIGTPTARILAGRGVDVDAFGRGRTPRLQPDVVVHFMLLNERDANDAVAQYSRARLVVISSCDVYRAYGQLLGHEPLDDAPAPLIDEDAPLRAQLYPYGRRVDGPWGPVVDYDKILVERVVRAAQPAATILRLPKVYGAAARDRPFARWLDWMRVHDTVPIGARQGRWRWTHGYVDDVGAAIALAAVDERAAGRVYNLGERETPTQRQRLLDIVRVHNYAGRVVDVDDSQLPPPLRDPHAGAPDLACDTTRIRRDLGFTEPTPYDHALRSL